jgi:hypothetical protein
MIMREGGGDEGEWPVSEFLVKLVKGATVIQTMKEACSRPAKAGPGVWPFEYVK